MSLSTTQKSLILLWFAHLFMDFCTGIWPIYKTVAQIDIVQAGLIAGISGFCGEIFQVMFGYFCDRGHRKKILLLGLVFASSILWITFTSNISGCFVLMLLLMIGSSAFHPAAAGFAGSLSQFHKGKTILFFASGGAIGLGISQIVFTSLMDWFNGHAVVLFIPLIAVLLFMQLHRFPHVAETGPKTDFRKFFDPIMHCKRSLTMLYFAQVANQGFIYAFMFLMPDLLLERSSHKWLCLGGGHCCFILGSALTMVPAGILCDRYGQRKILLTVICVATLLLYIFLHQPLTSLVGNILLLTTLGAFLGIVNPIIISWGNYLVPQSPSTVSAILMGFAWCVANFGPTCAGYVCGLYEKNSYLMTLSGMGFLLFIIVFLVFFLPDPRKELALQARPASESDPL